MKLGILTFHRARNYGAVLQAYGMQEYLRSCGYDASIVDYIPLWSISSDKRDNCRDWLSKNPKACLKRLFQYLRYKDIRHLRWDNFVNFRKSKMDLISVDSVNNLDAVFIGSDQVWSKAHTGGEFDPMFFGIGFNAKAISYAPSCSISSLNDDDKEKLSKLLTNISSISVREDEFKKLLQPLTNQNISVVVDPTILAGANPFKKIAVAPKKDKPYVLIYEITRHPEVLEFARLLAKELNADIVELTNGMTAHHEPFMDEAASPEEFLGYIRDAACVVTTSFHGTVFSILFETPFYTITQGNSFDIRMVNLLSKLDLKSRLKPLGETCKFAPVDFKGAHERLDELATVSKKFIADSLK